MSVSLTNQLAPDDAKSPIRFVAPLNDDLFVWSMHGQEKMGELSVFQVELMASNSEIAFDDVVGQQVTVILVLNDGERYFNGFITEFRYSGWDGVYSRYHATVRPWLWLLTRTSDCRIFQNMKVPEIIKEVFRLNNKVDYEERLSGSYRTWDYCVQYNESDFNFISRLMEQEGIYYFFEHHEDKHVLVMADDASAHNIYPGHPEISFDAKNESEAAKGDSLDTWSAMLSIVPTKYAVQDYDFENPKTDLLSRSIVESDHVYPIDDPEIFGYPGEYVARDDGSNYVEIRLQELQCQRERMHSSGDSRVLSPGCTFDLVDFPREDQNREYLTISIEHELKNSSFFAGGGAGGRPYRCRVEVMDKQKLPFRSPRQTPKPIVQGPQTAVVVGPEGDEIFTDEYGRIKVQFHWDRYGENDENSSCWVRVSQIWAGTKWGGIHIPRIGQEVVVSFLEGDPDRPLVTGSVYNANNMPPYALEANKTQSGIKSRSTLDGGSDNFNELRFEDKIGEEEVYLQAEKNQTILVKNDKSETVGHDETIQIKHDRTETVSNDETLTIENNRSVTVNVDQATNVGNNETRDVGVNLTTYVGGELSSAVAGNATESFGADLTREVYGNETHNVLTSQTTTVNADRSIDVSGSADTSVGSSYTIAAGSSISIESPAGITLTCGGAKVEVTPTSIKLSAGPSSVEVGPGGVTGKGPMVKLNA